MQNENVINSEVHSKVVCEVTFTWFSWWTFKCGIQLYVWKKVSCDDDQIEGVEGSF